MSDDLVNYLFDQLDQQIYELEDVAYKEDVERIEYHMTKIKDITEKLKQGLKKGA